MEKQLKVGIESNPDAATLDIIGETLLRGAHYYYGMTEGQHQVVRYDVYPNSGRGCPSCAGSGCDICLESDDRNLKSRVANLCTASGKMFIINNDWSEPIILGHELGHLIGCLHDEYCLDSAVPGNCSPAEGCQWCGHSKMAFSDTWNLCQDRDHELDPAEPCTNPNPVGQSNWATLPGLTFIPIKTPDNFNYERHHFNDATFVIYH